MRRNAIGTGSIERMLTLNSYNDVLCLTTGVRLFFSRHHSNLRSLITHSIMSAEVKQATSVIGNLSLSDVSTWDEHYDNPKAEIILVSNDKIGFRVDAWQFKKER